MISVSATHLRKNLFKLLEQVERGEVISIIKNGKEVARLHGSGGQDWRDRMTDHPKLLLPADEVFAPMEDIWEEYL